MLNQPLVEAIKETLALMMLQADSPPALTPDLVRFWAAVLEHETITPDQLKDAAPPQAPRQKCFPRPADIIAIVKGDAGEKFEAKSTLAWERVRSALRGPMGSLYLCDVEGDGAALWAASRIGLQELSDMTSETRPMKAAEFRRLYRVALEQGYAVVHIPGAFERQNRGRVEVLRPCHVGRPDLTAIPYQPEALEEPELKAIGAIS